MGDAGEEAELVDMNVSFGWFQLGFCKNVLIFYLIFFHMMHCYSDYSSHTAAVEYLYLVKLEFTNLFPGMTYLPEINSSSVSSIVLECAGKYIASVLDLELGVLVHPRWTSSPNWAKVF